MTKKCIISGNDITLIISDPLTLVMNCSWRQRILPDNTKIASVVALNKKTKI